MDQLLLTITTKKGNETHSSTNNGNNSKLSDINSFKSVDIICLNESERVNALDDCCTPHKSLFANNIKTVILNESERVNALDDCCTPHKNLFANNIKTVILNESERVNALDDCCTPHNNLYSKNFNTVNLNEAERVNALDDCCTPHKSLFANNLYFLSIEKVVSQYLKRSGNPQYPWTEFKIDKNKVLLINSIDGSFNLKIGDNIVDKGYNAIDCLIKTFYLNYESSIKWLKSIFLEEEVKLAIQDYMN